jgi:hypothetical protein
MPLDDNRIRGWLRSFEFRELFRLGLGWDNISRTLDVAVGDETFRLSAVAHKRGYTAWLCDTIPDRSTRLKIDHKVTKSSQEHFIVYADRDKGRQIWQWVRRQPGEPFACRERQFDVGQPGDRLIQSLKAIQFRLDQEERLGLAEVLDQVEQAFKAERVTRRFYERFKAEHTKFREFITGISDEGDLGWYTSITLNRLMFVYFIQKKGFLDGNVNYLRERLEKVRASRGRDSFQSFFRYFLLRLFHDGLGKTKADRKLDAALGALLGDVPYLNGGFFEVHQLEKANKEIDIPDAAFVALFDFFDQYEWHLDDRPLREDNEINPDVIGYIFEKYINQKQMGAYYTKEDITEYICKSTIIPFLFDAARAKCAIAFDKGSSLWSLLSHDPDRYIYPEVRHGVIGPQGEVLPLPGEIAAGVDDVSARDGWNATATERYALPTETWREHVARRERCLALREKLVAGEVHDIQDVVTLNLDIWQLARDAIVNAEGPELLRAFWQTIGTVTVLDPTCGSGAFLFAALRILESLYGDCVERMEQFLDEHDSAKAGTDRYQDFKLVVAQIEKHPNARYFFLKSIILSNLYGVDIMEEAVEICKLRLFLKLVAEVDRADRIEPLPDIDFNVQAGNTLIGFASLEQLKAVRHGKLGFDDDDVAEIVDQTDIVDKAFKQFRLQQTTHGGRVTREDKEELRKRLTGLNTTLDKYLAAEYGIAVSKRQELAAWKESHKPFHWFVEFYGIIRQGGFDVVVGNPPYVKMTKVREMYTLKGYRTDGCADIYAACLERVTQLANSNAYTGMIVPLSLAFSSKFRELRAVIYSSYRSNWFSSFGRIPAALFAHDVRVRNTIHLGAKAGRQVNLTTRLHRWFEEERGHLLAAMCYAPFVPDLWQGLVPKLNTAALISAFESAARTGRKMSHTFGERSARDVLYFKKSAYNWLTFCREMPPCYDARGKPIPHTQFGTLCFDDPESRDVAFVILNTKLQFAYWVAVGDDFHLTSWMFANLPLDASRLPSVVMTLVQGSVAPLEDAMKAATSFKLNAGKRVGNYNVARCRGVTDIIDRSVAEAVGFGDVMEDIELLYTQVVRTDFGDDDDGGEDQDE